MCVKYCLSGSPLETQYSELLLGSGHIGTICLIVQKFQTPREKQVSNMNTICTNNFGTTNHPYQLGNGGKPPEIHVTDTSQRLTMKATL